MSSKKNKRKKQFIGDFIFGRPEGNLIQQYMDGEDNEELVLELMALHNQYHTYIRDEEYVTRGSILACTYGGHLARIDDTAPEQIYTSSGDPVLNCDDCKAGENIPTFGVCRCPDTVGLPGRTIIVEDRMPMASPNGPIVPLAGPKCVPIPVGNWQQPGKNTVMIWNDYYSHYSAALKNSAVLACKYGGVISVVEVNHSTEVSEKEEIMLSPWLVGYKGEPSRAGGRVIEGAHALKTKERNALGDANAKRDPDGNRGIDWYSHGIVVADSGAYTINDAVFSQYAAKGKKAVITRNEYDGFVNEDNRYWVAVGPVVLVPDYNNKPEREQAIRAEQFEYGMEIDVVLQHDKTRERVYIECIVGDIKSHTYAKEYSNGIFQTGECYPNSTNKNVDGHADGSYIEIYNAPILPGSTPEEPKYDNGTMSDYSVVKIIVYKRGW